MGRIRTVKPEAFTHEGLYELEIEMGLPIRVGYMGLWTVADREGRFIWAPKTLKLGCLPHDILDFSRVLDALWTRGHIEKYASGGREYGFIPSWKNHQVINNRETPSVLPEPMPESILARLPTCEARVNDASSTPLVHAQGEGKGRERIYDASSTRKYSPLEDLKSRGIDEQVAKDWLAVRKLKKLAPNETAFDLIFEKIKKTSLLPNDVLKICCSKGWGGFETAWLEKEKTVNVQPDWVMQ